jgi:hypothetical protein
MRAENEFITEKKNELTSSFIPAEYNANIMIINKLRKFRAEILSTSTCLNGRGLVDFWE